MTLHTVLRDALETVEICPCCCCTDSRLGPSDTLGHRSHERGRKHSASAGCCGVLLGNELDLGLEERSCLPFEQGSQDSSLSSISSHLNPEPASVFLVHVLHRNPLNLEQVSQKEGCLPRCLLCRDGLFRATDGEELGQSNEG